MLDFLYFALGMFLLAASLLLYMALAYLVCAAARLAVNWLDTKPPQKQYRPSQGGSGTCPAPPKDDRVLPTGGSSTALSKAGRVT